MVIWTPENMYSGPLAPIRVGYGTLGGTATDAHRTRAGRGAHDRICRNGRGPDAGVAVSPWWHPQKVSLSRDRSIDRSMVTFSTDFKCLMMDALDPGPTQRGHPGTRIPTFENCVFARDPGSVGSVYSIYSNVEGFGWKGAWRKGSPVANSAPARVLGEGARGSGGLGCISSRRTRLLAGWCGSNPCERTLLGSEQFGRGPTTHTGTGERGTGNGERGRHGAD
eukprot:gene20556-biopygen11608